ncbi:MAG: FAD-dependent oxidoreductase [Candidatus Brockarchaeota archaeon]|nr:FAD-dependent oxidoreductase [Candidatus Brockarchaeota archaeon]
MKLEEARRLNPYGCFDVVVAGGGTAGAVAAIAAARNGVKTLLVEQFGFLGGSGSAALVVPMMPNHVGGMPLVRGISREIQQRLLEMGCAAIDKNGNEGWFNPEALKFVLEEMVLEAGGRILYFTFVEDVIMDGDELRGIVIANKSGRQAVFSKIVVDSTGDGDVAALAGVPFESGRKEDGVSQPMSLRFMVGNVNIEKLAVFLVENDSRSYVDPPLIEFAMVPGGGWPLEKYFNEGVEEGILEDSDMAYFQAFSVPGMPGVIAFNCPRIIGNFKGFNADHLTEAAIQGRRRISRLFKFLRKKIPGFENSYLAMTAQMVGVRESRRIIGEYVLSAQDYFNAKKFEDAVSRNRYPIDIHLPTSHLPGERKLGPEEYHEIPFRSLIPLRVENLIVACRALSASFEAHAAVRIQPNMRAIGQAAGVAAALCVKKGVRPRQLDGKELRETLIQQGAYL